MARRKTEDEAPATSSPVICYGMQVVERFNHPEPPRDVFSESALPPGRRLPRVLSGGDVLMIGPNGADIVVHPVKDEKAVERLLSEGWHFVNA